MPWLLAVSAMGLVMHLWHPAAAHIADICGRVDVAALMDPSVWRALIWDPMALVWDWGIMLVLMMAPLVLQQVSHIWRSNLAGRRGPSLAVFGLGYVSLWMLAGAAIIPIGIAISALAPSPFGTVVAVTFALGWSASPLAQAARNKCHLNRPIAVRGIGWLSSNLSQGVHTSAACVVACWPWMLVPLTVSTGHTVAMVIVAVYLLAERLAPAAHVRWRIPPGLVSLGLVRRTASFQNAGSLSPSASRA